MKKVCSSINPTFPGVHTNFISLTTLTDQQFEGEMLHLICGSINFIVFYLIASHKHQKSCDLFPDNVSHKCIVLFLFQLKHGLYTKCLLHQFFSFHVTLTCLNYFYANSIEEITFSRVNISFSFTVDRDVSFTNNTHSVSPQRSFFRTES